MNSGDEITGPSGTYEKDEASREKHCGRNAVAEFVYDKPSGEWVGKCPKGMTREDAQRMLDEGIANGWWNAGASGRPHAVWNIDKDGQVFRATETNNTLGVYHGFPERRRLFEQKVPSKIRRALEAKAKAMGKFIEMRRWFKDQPNEDEP